MQRKTAISTFVLVAGLALSACAAPRSSSKPVTPTPKIIGMPNPASVYCAEQGGTLDIQKTDAGEVGICVFADGSQCDEWAFFRGECKPGQSKDVPPAKPKDTLPNPASAFCEENNGNLEIVSGPGGEYGICHFPDGSQCEEWAFFRSECKPGQATAVTPPAAGSEIIGMPNPASAFCVKESGQLKIVTRSDGGQFGICIFKDGSLCEEWAYFRGECKPGKPTPTPNQTPQASMANPASVYCVEQGGTSEIIDEPDGEIGLCVLPSGNVCEEWALFRKECLP